ncbi:MAG: type 4a pilus biogenesis protein PilO [Dokdonella sp.]
MKLIDDLRGLDRNNVGGWPMPVKLFFCAMVFALLMALGWYLMVKPKQEELEGLVGNEQTLRVKFVEKQGRAANLEALALQLENMQKMLRELLRQLPNKTEMPDLLVDISQTALGAGITTEIFQPGPEQVRPEDYYAEKPIALKLRGTYHQFGNFISGVAALPRVVILTLHDVSFLPVVPDGSTAAAPAGAKRGDLFLEGTVKTYRYLEDDEVAALAPPPGTTPPPPPPPPNGGQ